MPYLDFPKDMKIKVFDSGEEVDCGNAVFASAIELKHLRFTVYKQGTPLGGSETLQVHIYSDSLKTNKLYSSDVVTVGDINNPDIGTTTNWLGRVRFDFTPEVPINPNITYYVSLEIDNYTRNADTFFMGIALDTPISVNVIDEQDPPVSFEPYGVS